MKIPMLERIDNLHKLFIYITKASNKK